MPRRPRALFRLTFAALLGLPTAAIAGPAPAAPAADAKAAAGEKLFRSRACAVCHSLTPGKSMNGPSLAGVFGRPVGKAAGYTFSPDLVKAKGMWDAKRMDAWLADPRTMFPSTRMATKVASAEERAAIIAYLRGQAGR